MSVPGEHQTRRGNSTVKFEVQLGTARTRPVRRMKMKMSTYMGTVRVRTKAEGHLTGTGGLDQDLAGCG